MQNGNMCTFFDKYPNILDNCVAINEIVSVEYGFDIDIQEISFDQTLPFLFSFINQKVIHKMALELRLYREIIDYHNKNKNLIITDKIRNNISIPIINKEEYLSINKCYRVLNKDNLFNSYLLSTKRVFYRFLILHKYKKYFPSNSFNQIYYSIKIFSAFLLFDDDIIDLEEDVNNNKQTLLTQFLDNNNYNIELAIQSVMPMVQRNIFNNNHLLNSYIKQYTSIYYE